MKIKYIFNQFLANILILYPIKTPENIWFSDIFKGYETWTRDGLTFDLNTKLWLYFISIWPCYWLIPVLPKIGKKSSTRILKKVPENVIKKPYRKRKTPWHISEFAKFRALYAQVPSCLACLSAHVPTWLTYLRANMPHVVTCSSASMPYVLMCSRANMSCVLTCSRALRSLMLTCLMCSRIHVPTCLCVPTCS